MDSQDTVSEQTTVDNENKGVLKAKQQVIAPRFLDLNIWRYKSRNHNLTYRCLKKLVNFAE